MKIQTFSFNDELESFYKDTFYFSYSSINKLLFSPRMFYDHYILKQKEDSTDAHLVSGRALHCLLLEPDTFDDQFIIMPGKVPSDNNLTVVNNIFTKYYTPMGNDALCLEDFPNEILTQLLTINLHQSLKTDQQRLDKMLTDQNKEYFDFLKAKENKTVIDQVTLDNCKVSVECLRNHTTVRALLQLDADKSQNIKILNEQKLSTPPAKYKFGFKGILDNVVIDYDAKKIFINDLKTTGKPLQDFPDSVEYYKYWIQAVMYQQLVWVNYIKDLKDYKEWDIIITFIVIDKYNQIYPFQVSRETLVEWKSKFLGILDILEYHYDNKDYTLPYELALGNVTL